MKAKVKRGRTSLPKVQGQGATAPASPGTKQAQSATANKQREHVSAPFGRKADTQENNARTPYEVRNGFGQRAIGLMPLKSLQR